MDSTYQIPDIQAEHLNYMVDQVLRSGQYHVTPVRSVPDPNRVASRPPPGFPALTPRYPIPPQSVASRPPPPRFGDMTYRNPLHSTPAPSGPPTLSLYRPPVPTYPSVNMTPGRSYTTSGPKAPKLPEFSGQTSGDDFDIWLYEVNCLIRGRLYPDHAILEAIRRSLKGKARTVLLHLGEFATLGDIIQELEGLYGNVASTESHKEKFYSATQESNESVADYSLRLEQLLRHSSAGLDPYTKNEMLRSRLGLVFEMACSKMSLATSSSP